MTLPRGIRNNNPGNVRWGSSWQGLVSQDKRTDKDFCQFTQPVYGLRAIVKILFTYQSKYGLNTIESIINRYAPPSENNTKGYIDRVAASLNVPSDQSITLTDDILIELIKAIVAVENGDAYYDYYSKVIITNAIKMAK